MIDVRESTDKLKILIVDDSELNRELLAGMLGDEYEIYQVENGKKAIDILEENREQFKLVLLRVQKRRFSSKGGARTFWESGFSKPVKKSIKDVKSVTLASSDLPRRETTRGTIAYRKNRKLGKPSTHD